MFCEKTPANLLEFRALLEIFPEARFVFVLRDPRDVAASMKEVARRHREGGRPPPAYCRDALASAEEIARYWAEGRAALDAAPERVTAVHYEDVVAEPEAQARRLCAALGLDYDPAMPRIEEAPSADLAGSLQSGFYYTPDQVSKGIERPPPEKFRAILTPAEIGLVEGAIPADPLIERYALTTAPGSLAASEGARRLRASLERERRIKARIRALGAGLRRRIGA